MSDWIQDYRLAMTVEQGERCPVCEGLDQPGLLHNVNAPYCSASTEQGDVEAMIDALVARAPQMHQRDFAVAALPLLMEASAALERAEKRIAELEKRDE